MGLGISKIMETQQEKMAEAQKGMAARQLEMQMQMRERMVAVQVAQARDLFLFFSSFCGISFPLLLLRAVKTRNPAFAAPLLPLSFVLAYQYDFAYHTKMERILSAADGILAHERDLLRVPGPTLSIEAIDEKVKGRASVSPRIQALDQPLR